jgi:hypothetical protein
MAASFLSRAQISAKMPGSQTFPSQEMDRRMDSQFVTPATMPILSGAEQCGPFWEAKPVTNQETMEGSAVTSGNRMPGRTAQGHLGTAIFAF